MPTNILETRGITKVFGGLVVNSVDFDIPEQSISYYGHIQALRGISLTVEEGEVVTLIGSNGAGKTTTLRSIHGVLPPREGKIFFTGEPIQGSPAHDMISRGIAQSPRDARSSTA